VSDGDQPVVLSGPESRGDLDGGRYFVGHLGHTSDVLAASASTRLHAGASYADVGARSMFMTREFCTLFDNGYVTVTPDYEVRVSEALRDEWKNGVRYYAHDKKRLRVIPELPRHQPSREALAWHREHVYLG